MAEQWWCPKRAQNKKELVSLGGKSPKAAMNSNSASSAAAYLRLGVARLAERARNGGRCVPRRLGRRAPRCSRRQIPNCAGGAPQLVSVQLASTRHALTVVLQPACEHAGTALSQVKAQCRGKIPQIDRACRLLHQPRADGPWVRGEASRLYSDQRLPEGVCLEGKEPSL